MFFSRGSRRIHRSHRRSLPTMALLLWLCGASPAVARPEGAGAPTPPPPPAAAPARALLPGVAGASPAGAWQGGQAAPTPPSPPAEEPAAEPDYSVFEGDVIGEIRVLNKTLFDPNKPGENKLLFRMANRLHRTTRPGVIQQQVLMQPGDTFSVEALEESERILRAKSYLYEAEIRPIPAGEDRVDLEVETRDVWTLRGGASFSRAGGENMYGFNLEDSNFLGTGKEITL